MNKDEVKKSIKIIKGTIKCFWQPLIKIKIINVSKISDRNYCVEYKKYLKPLFIPIIFIFAVPLIFLCSPFVESSFQEMFCDLFLEGKNTYNKYCDLSNETTK